MTALSIKTYRGEYSVLSACLPGKPAVNIGVLLLDPSSRKLYSKFRDSFGDVANPEDAVVLSELREDFAGRLGAVDGEEFLLWLEDSLSNVLRISGRESVMVRSFDSTLEKLFAEHVEPEGPAVRHRNCLPLFTMPVAAGYLDKQEEIVETAEEWLRVPDSVRPGPNKFLMRIEGRSMEPKIPDGALAVFRFGVVGSRLGRILLIELFDVADQIGRYTVKKYTSEKQHFHDGDWRHKRIRFIPLNPEFSPIEVKEEGQFKVIAEFERVLEPGPR